MKQTILEKNLLETFPGNVYWLDLECKLLGCNKRQAIALGFQYEKDVIGKHLSDLLPKKEADQVSELQEKVLKLEKTLTLEEAMTFQSEKRYFLSQKSPMLNIHGKIIGLIGYSIDITQQKSRSLKTIETHQKETEMVKGMQSILFESLSHDLRTPIHSMKLIINTLLDELENPKHLDMLQHMQLCIDRLFSHCSSIYEGFRNRKLTKSVLTNEPLNFQKICDDLISMHNVCALAKGIEVIGEYDANMPILLGDNQRIKEIILHLLSNAVKFTQKGGVSLRVSVFKKSDNRAIARICVKDTGVGIDPHVKTKIFEEFATEKPVYVTHYQGVGVGLSIVKKIVSELQGEIKVESNKGEGSTFIVYIPLKMSLENECIAATKRAIGLKRFKNH